MSDFIVYNCRLCGWEKRGLVGGALTFFFELRHCSSCSDVFPYRRPYPGESHPEPSLLCPCCGEETSEWWANTREDLAEERELSKRLSCPRCQRKSVHGIQKNILDPMRLTRPASFARLFFVK